MDLISELVMRIAEFDGKLLLALNGMNTPFLDRAMWMVSGKYTWVPLYFIMAFAIFRRETWRRGMLCMLMIGMVVAFTDQTCASLLRPAIGRLRPSNPDNPISAFVHVVNGYRGGCYGFPSCHAANSFALAVFFSCLFRKKSITAMMFLWATLVGYSRIYLGVHYPGDVLGGMVAGSTYALALFRIYRWLWLPRRPTCVCTASQ